MSIKAFLRPLLVATGVACLGPGDFARAESKHVFGIHFFGWGANSSTDFEVMSHRTGWVVEANATHDGGPNVGGRYRPATAAGFTMIQRLDWKWDQTVPISEADQNTFAQQCGNWAAAIKPYCRYYSIGNEVEFFNVNAQTYAAGFEKVRNAIKAQQPEAVVAIGHWNNIQNVRAVMQILGPDGYDGVTAHTNNALPTGLLDMLDEENARPGVGVFITEWGWVKDTNPNSASAMNNFYHAIRESNAGRDRQVYAACFFVYPTGIGWDSFALAGSTIDKVSFRNCTVQGTSVNSFAQNPIIISDLFAEIPDSGTTIPLSWKTNFPARRQLWWTPIDPPGNPLHQIQISDVFPNHLTSHQFTIGNVSSSTGYWVMPNSTADGYGDAGGRRFRVKTGTWASTATQVGPRSVRIEWSTDWPADSTVEYGPTPSLGQESHAAALVTSHQVTLNDMDLGEYYYRILSAEAAPDENAPLVMRSPIRPFAVEMFVIGDFDGDGDVDMDDFAYFQRCLTGTGIIQDDPACKAADLDGDGDVDQVDFNLFFSCLAGANVPPPAECTN